MPNHVSHKMVFVNDACNPLIMMMKTMFDGKQSDGILNFNLFVPLEDSENWYDDRIQNWGTKWGAYEQDDSELHKGILTFDTAWSTATPIWEKIAELYPDVEIIIYYADEDTGNNLGIINIKEGDVTVTELSGSPIEDKVDLLNEVEEGYSRCSICGDIEHCEYPCECVVSVLYNP